MLRLLVAASLLACALARPNFPTLIPNGAKVPNCRHIGHIGCAAPTETGKPNNNEFGKDFLKAGRKWTKEFCMMDSDEDGLTNGEELGDPCCEWTPGKTPRRTTEISHPGQKDKANTAAKCPAGAAPGAAPAAGASPGASPAAGTTPGTATVTPAAATPTTAATESSAATPSPSASAGGDSGSDPVCFPADALVTLKCGCKARMDQLPLGTAIEVSPGVFSPVFMFTHRLRDVTSSFVSLTTSSGAVLELSPGHFLYSNGALGPASEVRVGATLEVAGKPDAVVKVETVTKQGLYNPQTLHGDIVVNGVRASTYTSAVRYEAAHSALTPLRALYAWFGVASRALEGGYEGLLPRAEL